MEKPVLLLLICIIGFLPVFLPEGIIGYGLAGTLIGGDRTHAVAISTELFVFFWGVFCARKKQNTFLEKRILLWRRFLLLLQECLQYFI